LTLIYNLNFKSYASCGHDPNTHTTQKLKFKGHGVQNTEWEQTDGQTDSINEVNLR